MMRVVLVMIGIVMALGIYGGARWFLKLCYDVEVIGPLLCRRLLDLTLLMMMSVLFLSNLVNALGSFFLANDLELWITAPIASRRFFMARFIEQTVNSSWMVLVFTVPLMVAFAQVSGTPTTYWLMAASLPPMAMIASALATIVILLLVRMLPAARARTLIVGLLFVTFVVLYVLARLFEPERFLNPEGFSSVVSFVASFSTPSAWYLPSHWASTAITSTFRDQMFVEDRALMLIALWSGAFALTTIASFCFRSTYASAYSSSQSGRDVARVSRVWGWVRGDRLAQEKELRSPMRRGATRDLLRAIGVLFPSGPMREFAIKDLKIVFRDAAQWSQLILLVALVFVYLYNFRHFRHVANSGLIGPVGLFLLAQSLAAFVTTALSVRFAFPLISIEGKMLWLLKTSPISARDLVRAKWIAAFPPILIVAETLSIASAIILEMPHGFILLSAVSGLMAAIVISALAIGLGAIVPEFKFDHPAEVAASFGGLVCMSVTMVVTLALVACLGYPAHALYRLKVVHTHWFALSLIALGLLTSFGAWLPLMLGIKKLERHEIQ